jgi:hypothetical protein
MKNAKDYNRARAGIAAVVLARLGCSGFLLYYLFKADFMGVGVCIGLFWIVGWLLPET